MVGGAGLQLGDDGGRRVKRGDLGDDAVAGDAPGRDVRDRRAGVVLA